MTLAIFRLESFGEARSRHFPEALFGREAVDNAFAEGLAQGLARKDDDELRNLGAGLERLCRALGEDDERRAALRHEAVNALAPILNAILDSVAPAGGSARLEAALRNELSRLAQLSSPLRVRIACGPRLRGLVERCCAELGLSGLELTDFETDRISLILQGGRIEVSPEKITEDIRALISELNEDDTTWKH